MLINTLDDGLVWVDNGNFVVLFLFFRRDALRQNMLHQRERELITQLRTNGVMQDVEATRLPAENGFVALCCADCDQHGDIIRFLHRISSVHREEPRVHLLSLNGGPILLSPQSGLQHSIDVSGFLFDQIKTALEIKQLSTVVLIPHAPCAIATARGFSTEQVLRHAFLGKRMLKKKIRGIRVGCIMHVDYGDKRRGYFVPGKSFHKENAKIK